MDRLLADSPRLLEERNHQTEKSCSIACWRPVARAAISPVMPPELFRCLQRTGKRQRRGARTVAETAGIYPRRLRRFRLVESFPFRTARLLARPDQSLASGPCSNRAVRQILGLVGAVLAQPTVCLLDGGYGQRRRRARSAHSVPGSVSTCITSPTTSPCRATRRPSPPFTICPCSCIRSGTRWIGFATSSAASRKA